MADQFSLEVSPSRLVVGQLDIETVQKITVINRGQASVAVNVEKRNFVAGVDGAFKYEAVAPYSASAWVTVSPASFTLASGTTQVVTATVKQPAMAEPGDHELAVVFLVPSGKTSGNIKINRGIATPMFITVPGPTTNTATISNLHAPGFASGEPVTITATIHNTGNVHRDFRAGSPLTIDAPGRAAAFPDFTVTRGAVRDISTTWNPPLFCICNPTVRIFNADGTASVATVRVIVFPVRLAIIGLVSILIIVGAVLLARRRYKTSVARAAAKLHRAAADPV